jgi:hypothetical protein
LLKGEGVSAVSLVFSLIIVCAATVPIFEPDAPGTSAFAAPPAPDGAFRLPLAGENPSIFRGESSIGWEDPDLPALSVKKPPSAYSGPFESIPGGVLR